MAGGEAIPFMMAVLCSSICSAGVDYFPVDETVEFAAGETSREVLVGIPDDIFPETNKTFEVFLACSPGVYLSPYSYTTVRILNDDPDLPGVCVHVCVHAFVCACMRVCVYVL